MHSNQFRKVNLVVGLEWIKRNKRRLPVILIFHFVYDLHYDVYSCIDVSSLLLFLPEFTSTRLYTIY